MQTSKAEIVEAYLNAGAELRAATSILRNEIVEAAVMVARSFKSGGKLLAFGNGGSAADAQHVAAEFSGRFRGERPPLPAMALSANTSAVTAIGNDFGFEQVFARQVRAFARPGDVALGISTSGRSSNVIEALKAARELGAHTVGLCGRGGRMAEFCDVLLAIPSDTTSLIQEVHIAIGHLLCIIVEAELYG